MEKQLIPKLRFPEFKSEFVKFEFSEIAKRGKKSYNPNKDSENLPCIELESLTQETGQLIKTFDSINLKSNKTRFSKNEVLFGKLRPYLKKYLLTTFEGVCTSEIWVFQGKLVSNPFLYYLIQTDKFNFEANVSSGSKMPRTDWDYLSGIKLSIPNNSKEQQKIASFLSDVDAKITKLTKKKELLEQYKKGIMQKIFNQELRFKDNNGNEFPRWENKRLMDVAEIKRGAGSQYIKYTNDKVKGIRLIRITDFLGGEEAFIESTEEIKRFRLSKDDLLIAGTGATAGITFKIPDEFINYAYSYNAPRIRVVKANPDFIIYVLKSNLILRQQNKLFTGNAQPFLDTNSIKKFKIELPCLAEQAKIANFLSDIDIKIEDLNTKIEKSKTFKKGLLQKMFV